MVKEEGSRPAVISTGRAEDRMGWVVWWWWWWVCTADQRVELVEAAAAVSGYGGALRKQHLNLKPRAKAGVGELAQ